MKSYGSHVPTSVKISEQEVHKTLAPFSSLEVEQIILYGFKFSFKSQNIEVGKRCRLFPLGSGGYQSLINPPSIFHIHLDTNILNVLIDPFIFSPISRSHLQE